MKDILKQNKIKTLCYPFLYGFNLIVSLCCFLNMLLLSSFRYPIANPFFSILWLLSLVFIIFLPVVFMKTLKGPNTEIIERQKSDYVALLCIVGIISAFIPPIRDAYATVFTEIIELIEYIWSFIKPVSL